LRGQRKEIFTLIAHALYQVVRFTENLLGTYYSELICIKGRNVGNLSADRSADALVMTAGGPRTNWSLKFAPLILGELEWGLFGPKSSVAVITVDCGRK
jgi:hypothetical protein